MRKVGEDLLFQAEGARLGGSYRLTMPGLFNVDNALAAIALCQGLGLPPEAVRTGLAQARAVWLDPAWTGHVLRDLLADGQGVLLPGRTGLAQARAPGRMEVFSSADGNVTAIVDYAHNRMSFPPPPCARRGRTPTRRGPAGRR